MANSLFNNPIIITGSLATSYKAQMAAANKIGTLFTLIVDRIRWVNPGTSQSVTIGDPISGLTLWNAKSNSSGEDVDEDFSANPRVWQDFEINALVGGGTIFIYTR